MRRMGIRVLILLGAWVGIVQAEEPRCDVLEDGVALHHRLGRCCCSWTARVDVPADATTLTVVVVGHRDLEVRLGRTATCGRAAAVTAGGGRHLVLRVERDADRPTLEGAWYLTVVNPWAPHAGVYLEALALVDRPGPGVALVPGHAPPASTTSFRLPFPRRVTRLTLDGVTTGTRFTLRGPYGMQTLGTWDGPRTLQRAEAPAGVWTLTLEAADNAPPHGVTVRWADGEDDAPRVLRDDDAVDVSWGPTGAWTRPLWLPVRADRRGFVVEAVGAGADLVDLRVREADPAHALHGEAAWSSVDQGTPGRVVVGGEATLPARPLRLEISTSRRHPLHRGRLRLRRTPRRGPRDDPPWMRAPAVARDAWQAVAVPAPQGAAWWRLEGAPMEDGWTARVAGATEGTDLVVVSRGDGRRLAVSRSARVDEVIHVPRGRSPDGAAVGVRAAPGVRRSQALQVRWGAGQVVPAPIHTGQPVLPVPAGGVAEIRTDGGAAGSAVCVGSSGHLITSRHVLADAGADGGLQRTGILVALPVHTDQPPRQRWRAEVVAEDAALDLALLRVTAPLDGDGAVAAAHWPGVPLEAEAAPAPGAEVSLAGYPTEDTGQVRVPLRLVPARIRAIEGTHLVVDRAPRRGHSGGAILRGGRLVGVIVARRGTDGLAIPVSALPAAWLARALGRSTLPDPARNSPPR